MSEYTLSTGSLKSIMNGKMLENVIMQVLGCKKINTSTSSDKQRFRLVISDGIHAMSYAMLTIQSNTGSIKGEIPVHSIIKIKKYVTSLLANTGKAGETKLLVILDLEIVKDGNLVGKQIGSPATLTEEDFNEKNENDNKENKKFKRETNEITPPPSKRQNLGSTGSSDHGDLKDQLVLPIASVTPYQNRWVIKGRVLKKSDIRTWSNSRGEGKLFSMDLFDNSGEIRLTGFKEMVDKYYDLIESDKVYYISKCMVKLANKQYSTLKNDYELSMTSETVIQECTDNDDNDAPKINYKFIQIDKIVDTPVNSHIDIIAICKEVKDCQTFTSKATNREMVKRDIILVDQSKTSVVATLWGSDAQQFEGHSQVIVAKGMRVGEFGGAKNLSVGAGTVLKINPDIPEVNAIRGWYDNGGNAEELSNISARTSSGTYATNWHSFKEVLDLSLGNSEKGDYYQTKGTVLFIKPDNLFYKGCASDNCNKKVIDLGNNMYRCEKCNVERDTFKYRLMGNWNIGDYSGSQWVTMFSEQCETVLGKTAAEIGSLSENDQDKLQEVLNEANFKQFIFRCRAKVESYNDEVRLRSSAVRVEPINYKEYDDHLISQIKSLMTD